MDYIKWLGHAAFEVFLDNKKLVIDPWLRENPTACCKPEEIKDVNFVLVTHDHGDHLGDGIDIAKSNDATFISIYELVNYASKSGVKSTIGMNIGGSIEVDGLKIVMTPALHSSLRGSPTGFIVIGKRNAIYHAGDTGLFSDIKYYHELYPFNIALVPIGGVYTMDAIQAAKFLSFTNPEYAIPMHYNTFPAIKVDPKEFEKYTKKFSPKTKVVILKPGKSLKL